MALEQSALMPRQLRRENSHVPIFRFVAFIQNHVPTIYLLKCLLMAFVIWNISSRAFPNTGFNFSSATISRRFFGSCSLCFLM